MFQLVQHLFRLPTAHYKDEEVCISLTGGSSDLTRGGSNVLRFYKQLNPIMRRRDTYRPYNCKLLIFFFLFNKQQSSSGYNSKFKVFFFLQLIV